MPAHPWAGVALARARQLVAQPESGETSGTAGATSATGTTGVAATAGAADRPRPEWATATLIATEDRPLLDGDLDLVPLRRPPVHLATGPVPALGVGELIGRRVELRQTLRALRGESGAPRSVVLTGIGGVGKSSVAGRVMARLTEEGGWVCSATTGTWSLDSACAALRADLHAATPGWARAVHDQLATLPADDGDRLRFLERVLRLHPVVLVLDNFEDNSPPVARPSPTRGPQR